MKLAFILLSVLLGCANAWSAPALVQFVAGVGNNGSTTNAITITGVTAANELIVPIANCGGTSISSVVDSAGGTVSNALPIGPGTGGTCGGTGTQSVALYYEQNAASGTHIFTVTFSSSDASVIGVGEFSGTPTSSSLDVAASPNTDNSFSSVAAANSITPAATGELLIYLTDEIGDANTCPSTYNSSLSQIDCSAHVVTMAWAYAVVSGTSAQTATGTYGGNVSWGAGAALFKAGGGGGSCTNHGYTSAGGSAIPTASSTSVWLSTGAFGTTPCDGTGTAWWQIPSGSFGTQ